MSVWDAMAGGGGAGFGPFKMAGNPPSYLQGWDEANEGQEVALRTLAFACNGCRRRWG